MNAVRPIREWTGVDRARFEREVLVLNQPAVLRGVVAQWPAVAYARESDQALCRFLAALDSGHAVDALMLRPEHQGRIFYSADWRGFNYLRNQVSLTQVMDQLQRYALFARPPSVAVQSALTSLCAPGFTGSHPMSLLDPQVAPRFWLGNAITTPTHMDESHNVACVVAGQRQFTLFPPEQIGNLYIGPVGHAPTGTPISLVDLQAPDLERYPRFATAMEQAQQAVLGPGDAIYIPPLWWHHVVSKARLNLLVNYWWKTPADSPTAMNALLHTMLALRELPLAQRQAWQTLFSHWVFAADESTTAHLAPPLLGVHGPLTAQLREQLRLMVLQGLEPPATD